MSAAGTKVYTRSGLNWTSKLTAIATALAELPAD